MAQLCQDATAAVQAGVEIIVLSDRPTTQNIGAEYSYIPPLLAVGAVHHHLIRQGLRLRTSFNSRYGSMLEYSSLCLLDWLWCFGSMSLLGFRKCASVVE